MDDRVAWSQGGCRALAIARCALFVTVLASCLPAGAAERYIYRSLDDQGRAVYSEYPPPPGVPATRVDSKPAGSTRPSAHLSTRIDPNRNTSDAVQPPVAAAKPKQKSLSKPGEIAEAKTPCERDDCKSRPPHGERASK